LNIDTNVFYIISAGSSSQLLQLQSEDGVAGADLQGVSKLRARTSTNLTDKDSR